MLSAIRVAPALAEMLAARPVLFGALPERPQPPGACAFGVVTVRTLYIVLGDQLSREVSSLRELDPSTSVVLMMELADECRYVGHHKQKIVLFLAAMRHFAAELRADGVVVDYVALNRSDNTGNLTREVERAVGRHKPDRIVMTEPGEWRLKVETSSWGRLFGLPTEIREDDRFFASHARFRQWAHGRASWRMEHFYRVMRREHDVLMDGDKPAGGQWNFDPANRKPLPRSAQLPSHKRFVTDAVTREVIELVTDRFPDNFGTLADFDWPVTRDDALAALEDFITVHLPDFGDYQDAMKAGEPFVHHSLLAPAINIGLLSPREVCQAAEHAWRNGTAPLNAVEGFIRQILGWREYVRGIYWASMPGYAERNFFGATRPLPGFYWSGRTDMGCLRRVISDTMRHAYSHHIQRLMVTGNFALLAGIAPQEIERWYLAVYADAIEWVEMPNTIGMAVYADGGLMASKPYAASGAYINRMSDFCKTCRYDVKRKTGPDACPFNYLYWAFLIQNEGQLKKNPRMGMPYKTLATWNDASKSQCLAEANEFLNALS